MSKINVIGGSGFLGSKLVRILSETNTIVGTYQNKGLLGLHKLEITDKKSVDKFIGLEKPEIVIHTAAKSDPDGCEADKELSERVNHIGTKNVVDACRTHGSKLVYISTVYVFDGEKGNYQETDPCNPINFYGKTKLKAEQEVLALENSVIIRFDILYGFNSRYGNNGFFSKIMRGKVEVNNDQKRQPLLVDDVAYAVKVMLEGNHSGIYHLAGPENLTKYELGLALEKIVRDKSELIPISEKQQVARRPKDVSLDASKAINIGVKFHSLSEGIELIKQQYESSRT